MKSVLLIVLFLADSSYDSLLDGLALSGRCATLSESPDARTSRPMLIAPGPPPLLSFRSYEGKLRQRFANSDLMLDDAGH